MPEQLSGAAHEAFTAAARLAPEPAFRDEATAAGWLAHFAALGLAAHAAFRDAARVEANPDADSRPDLGYLLAIVNSATAAAVALVTPPEEVGAKLVDVSRDSVGWLIHTLYERCGINPAELCRWLDAADFPVDVATASG